MTKLEQVLIDREGVDDAKDLIELACKNLEYDMEEMSFIKASRRALDDLCLDISYMDDLETIYHTWILNKVK